MGENIGATARAMWNFGLDRLRVVAPRDLWPNPAAVAMASGAGRLLDEAVLCDSTAQAIGDCAWVLATTARPRGLTKPVMAPRQAMQAAAAQGQRGKKVAVLFGPESAGLANDDIARANAIITAPTNPLFSSLNLAQCALLVAYEWQYATRAQPRHEQGNAPSEHATQAEVEALAQHYEQQLQAAGFFFPVAKARGMKTGLRNMWSRMPLTSCDVRILHGMLRQLVRAKCQAQSEAQR